VATAQIGDEVERPDSATPSVRPSARRWSLWWLLVIALMGLGIDGALIEPYRVEITHYEIQGAVGATSLKIAHLTDLHTRGIGRRERVLLAALAAEKPDVIVITGDSLTNFSDGYEACRKLYEQLHAPLGVWFVRGNWENEYPLRPIRREREFYQNVGVHFLLNANAELRPGIWLIGFDDPSSSRSRLDNAFAGVPPNVYRIALFHSPAFFDSIAGQVNLALAGHTHGGQIRIPYLRPFWLPAGSGRFLEGWYGESGSSMYVGRGLGTSVLPIRFLCRPEITFITIHS